MQTVVFLLSCFSGIDFGSTTLTSQSGFTLSGSIEFASAGRLQIVCNDLDILDGGTIDASGRGEANDSSIPSGAGGMRNKISIKR